MNTPTIPFDSPYSLTLNLTDGATGQTGSVTIAGVLQGSFDVNQYLLGNASGNPLGNLFTSPATQTLTLGSTQYTVSAAAYTEPTVPQPAGYSFVGGGIDVTVTPMTIGPTTPEPGTAALAGLGLAGLGLVGRFRRRARPAPAAA
ncbi:PEP-CTERM sorting domain-containing protein [Fimbriiglobus ruber]|uniref:Ice-binding protein C-terminal domain-containing protein n=1 Tax=Fimbriiglobus ruber TaxID=1908690 RepID=A0A225DHC7_9BACT|nr:PEP-CTERM sorting domain-containing protein [Fimbriiglobus ruber]OWK40842.1 hypothetical protein FRUB_04734 [Fimbriiglobus ruber]